VGVECGLSPGVNFLAKGPVIPAPDHIAVLICHGQGRAEMVVVVEMNNFLCQCCRYGRGKQENAHKESAHDLTEKARLHYHGQIPPIQLNLNPTLLIDKDWPFKLTSDYG